MTVRKLALELGIEPATLLEFFATFYEGAQDPDTEWLVSEEQILLAKANLHVLSASGPDLPEDRLFSISSEVQSLAGGPEEGFRRLVLSDWRQFDHVDIDLSQRLTIITGENGAGKSTLLNLLSSPLDGSTQFLGTPSRDKGGFYYKFGRARVKDGQVETFGSVTFDSGRISHLCVTTWGQSDHPSFTVEYRPYHQVTGISLDAQRVIGPYSRVESVPPRFRSATEIANEYRSQLRSQWIPHVQVKSPSLLIKESLIAAALYGEGNSYVTPDPRAAEVWRGFQGVLQVLFPESLGFRGLRIDQAEVVLDTSSGSFALEASSGGLAAVFSLAWQIYLYSIDQPTFTVCFDEPENHLHPSLQRSLMPGLLEAFPLIRFIVATHSPFVVTSSREANIYALRRNQEGKVRSEALDLNGQAFSAEQVLEEVLGVGSLLPTWAQSRLDSIVAEFQSRRFSSSSVQRLKDDLQSAGLRLTMPEVNDAFVADHIADPQT